VTARLEAGGGEQLTKSPALRRIGWGRPWISSQALPEVRRWKAGRECAATLNLQGELIWDRQ